MVLDESRQRLYVLNRFSASISVVNLQTMSVLTNVPFFDPTPAAVKIGRKHLYDTRHSSGLGHTSCGSCHVDARFDRLAWDLGNPAGDISQLPGSGLEQHPMKGPMVTMTFQDFIVPEEFRPMMPLHWRGDRPTLEDFNITFTDLQGREDQLTTNEMSEFKDFLATIHFPPSRFRNFDNSPPTNMPLPGFFGVNANGLPDTTPLPNGNAFAGQDRFMNEGLSGIFPLTSGQTTCTTCHNFLSGRGLEGDFLHVGREDARVFRTVQLRSLSEKLGMDLRSTNSLAGFGFRFDGRAATLTDLLVDIFRMTNNQSIADTTAFLLAFPGSDFVSFQRDDSQDSHAAVGRQFTLHTPDDPVPAEIVEWLRRDLSESSVDVVARGVQGQENRSWRYNFDLTLQSDRNGEPASFSQLLALASVDRPLILTLFPLGSSQGVIDRDGDGLFDQTEAESGLDAADARSRVRILRVDWNQGDGTNIIVGIAPPGSQHRLQHTERLENTTWVELPDIGSADLSTGTLILFDRTAANATQRFYRSVLMDSAGQ